jgi:carbon-monoxide dehydrogenase large subunit
MEPGGSRTETIGASPGPRFGSSAHTTRSEDEPLVTGRGRFTDDIALPGQVHAAFVRAPVAHATILSIDVAAAAGMPGVIAVITGRELAAKQIGSIPPIASFRGRNGEPMFHAEMPVLAADRVR